jgi:PAS domain S-box-containing protein
LIRVPRIPVPARLLRPAVVIALGLAVAFGTVQLSSLYRSIGLAMHVLSRAETDNRTWLVAQGEVDLLKYRLALSDAIHAPDEGSIKAVHTAFDILYSRVMLIEAGMRPGDLPKPSEVQLEWMAIKTLVVEDAAIFDAGDRAVAAELQALRQRADAAAVANRTFTVASLQQTMERSMLQREEMRQLVQRFFVTGALMFVLLITLAVSMMIVLRRLESQAKVESRLNSNLNKLINASIDGVLVVDQGGRILGCNKASQTMFGLTEEAFREHGLADVLSVGEDGDVWWSSIEPWRALLVNGQIARLTAIRRDGTGFPAEVVLTSDRGSDQQPIHFVFIRDISEHVRIESSLKTARDAAVRGEEAKSRFLAVMSHEMRTPLNGLIAALDIVQKTTRLSRKQADFLDLARQCGNTSLEQIDDVLELTRLGRDDQPEEIEDFDLTAALIGITDQNRPHAALRNNTLSIALPQSAPLWVTGHRRLLSRILLNLLGNAIKFTSDGAIALRASLEEAPDGTLNLSLQVADTGIGIPSHLHDVIFSDFETIDSSFARLREGSGLGLGIVRRAVDLMGGSIRLESEEARGSTFTVRVPLRRALAVPAAAPAPAASVVTLPKAGAKSGLAVLIAEDNAINRIVLVEMLRVLGCRIDEATNGAEAVRLATRTRYDLILMDLSMPEMDGLEATKRLRAAGASRLSRIVALTAHVMPETRGRMLDAGLDEILAKPVTLESLVRLIDRGPAGAPEAAPQEGAELLSTEVISQLRVSFPQPALNRLVDAFLRETDEVFAALRLRPAAAQSRAALHRAAGSAAVFGALRLKGLLNDAETAVRRSGRPCSKATLAKIEACWSQTQAELLRQVAALDPAPLPTALAS